MPCMAEILEVILMDALTLVITILQLLCGLAIIVVVLFQSGKSAGLSGAIGGVGGFMAQSMTDYTFYNYRVALLFFAVLALGASFARLAEQEVEDR